eukprot:1951848-Pleurochrysis_carterae.AAC.2
MQLLRACSYADLTFYRGCVRAQHTHADKHASACAVVHARARSPSDHPASSTSTQRTPYPRVAVFAAWARSMLTAISDALGSGASPPWPLLAIGLVATA